MSIVSRRMAANAEVFCSIPFIFIFLFFSFHCRNLILFSTGDWNPDIHLKYMRLFICKRKCRIPTVCNILPNQERKENRTRRTATNKVDTITRICRRRHTQSILTMEFRRLKTHKWEIDNSQSTKQFDNITKENWNTPKVTVAWLNDIKVYHRFLVDVHAWLVFIMWYSGCTIVQRGKYI